MVWSRTQWLVGVALVCQCAGTGWAQKYPSKPIRYLVADAAGSGSDTIGRIVATGLISGFGQQVVVDNRPGASGTIGADIAAKAPADGYTVLQISSALAAATSLYRNLPFDLIRDFAPVTQLAASPQVLVVHPSLPVTSVSELIKFAKGKGDAIAYGSAGTATSTHLAAELFKAQADVNMLHVPYRGGGPAITAVISGETSVYFAPVAASLQYIRGGRLRALAVTTAKRVPQLPGVPTIAEAGVPGYQAAQWYGLLMPAKSPREAISAFREVAVAALNNISVNKQLSEAGYVTIGDSSDEFGAYLKSEIVRLGEVIKKLGLKAN